MSAGQADKRYRQIWHELLLLKTRLQGGGGWGGSSGVSQLTGDVTAGPGSGSQAATIANDAVSNAKLANMANATIKARKTASTGDPEDCTLSEVLDFIGSAAQGDILYRGSSGWARLGAGTSGHFLKTQGTGANPTWATAAGGGGGAATIYTSAYGSPPSSPASGDLWLPSDSFYVLRYDGSAWVPWGPIFPLTAPVDGDFAWVNQGGASVVTTNGGIALRAPATAGDNWRVRVKSAPSAPYTITACLLPCSLTTSGGVGLVFRESGTGELQILGYRDGSLFVVNYTNPTTFSSTPLAPVVFSPASCGLWLRIADDNTNRLFSVSADGINFVQIFSTGRTTFLTADQVGFIAHASFTTYDAVVTLLSWKQG